MSTVTADYDYELPPELIAQTPTARREGARMMVVSRATGAAECRNFTDFPEFLRPGDCLVLNDTRVLPARLQGHRPTGGRVEALLLEPVDEFVWRALLRPGRRMTPGSMVALAGGPATFEVIARDDDAFLIRFDTPTTPAFLEQYGAMPLPPYIAREAAAADSDRYQTVFADVPGAVAAPTAGLHFTTEILEQLQARGIAIAKVTLHVGIGTFRPVEVEDVREHVMHDERYSLSEAAAATINHCRDHGGRIVAVGTTAVRTLETCATTRGHVAAGSGRTRIFLYPPKTLQVVDVLLTNFHLPKSTLMMLVATMIGREHLLAAYHQAVAARFRFYSYGDCMLIVP